MDCQAVKCISASLALGLALLKQDQSPSRTRPVSWFSLSPPPSLLSCPMYAYVQQQQQQRQQQQQQRQRQYHAHHHHAPPSPYWHPQTPQTPQPAIAASPYPATPTTLHTISALAAHSPMARLQSTQHAQGQGLYSHPWSAHLPASPAHSLLHHPPPRQPPQPASPFMVRAPPLLLALLLSMSLHPRSR
jgi:hypothetical protein